MQDKDYGWTVEMQIKTAARGLQGLEVPVRYRKRVARSEISTMIRGIVGAVVKILDTIGKEGLSHRGAAGRAQERVG